MNAKHEPGTPLPWNEQQQREVQVELDALLSSPLFRQSKRYPAFLRYVVESTLHGGNDELKERTIGMEVFGRQPHYDTSLDPTVRLTAAEVRKRLAQYYQQAEHGATVHIELHPGSYIPTFTWPGREEALTATEVVSPAPVLEETGEPHAPVESEKAQPIPAPRPRSRWIVFAGIAALLLGSVFVYRYLSVRARAGDLLTPLLRDSNSVMLVLPDLSKAQLVSPTEETDATTVMSHIRYSNLVDFNDSVALAQLTAMLGRQNKPYKVKLSSDTNFDDLQGGSTILIGAVDNPWTLRFLESLPYSIVRRGEMLTFDIVRRGQGMQQGWSLDLTQPYQKLQQDYGILVLETDTMTGRPVLIVAGLGQNGTSAGIRLLADPALARGIMAGAPKGWSGRNLEVVFKTQVIADEFGPPVIVAREYW